MSSSSPSLSLPPQSTTFIDPSPNSPDLASKLASEFKGKTISSLRTPALIIDRNVFAQNCDRMHETVKEWGWQFRAHIKTHKTVQGTRLQLQSSAGTTHSIVASTLQEAWLVIDGGLVADGTVKDILYGLPLSLHKIEDLAHIADKLASHDAALRIFVDHPDHVRALETYNAAHPGRVAWSAFFKVDLGSTKRAGLVPQTPQFLSLLRTITASPAVSLHGFYVHAGTSYASKSLTEAEAWLTEEIRGVLDAADVYRDLVASSSTPNLSATPEKLVLSVGSTPTAHAFASPTALSALSTRLAFSNSTMELHAGNYPMLDLQQVATSLVPLDRVAYRILSGVISVYEGRGAGGEDEAMCDAGGLAFTRDTGPIEGFGDVVGVIPRPGSATPLGGQAGLMCESTGWRVGRMSQEHGILTLKKGDEKAAQLNVGDTLEIVGQHACVIAAAYPWFYVIDSSQGAVGEYKAGEVKVVDVWVPCKGW